MLFNDYIIENEKEILEYKKKNLKVLFDFIPLIKKTKDFKNSPLVKEFPKLAYESKIMIDFDWSEWIEGSEIVDNIDFDYSTLDEISLCKLLTAVIQSESYIHNGLVDYFEDGIILDLLENLKHKIGSWEK